MATCPTPDTFRSKALNILADVSGSLTVGLELRLIAIVSLSEDNDFGEVSDSLNRAAFAVRSDGEDRLNEAQTAHETSAAHEAIGASKELSKLATECRREHERQKIRDRADAALRAPASEVLAAMQEAA